jgi:hypothetical protein
LEDAVLASAAIPGIFAAPTINGQVYVDGGIREEVPIKAAIKAGATVVYAVVASPSPTDTEQVENNIVSIAKRAVTEIMPNEILRKDLDTGASSIPIFTIQPTLEHPVHDGMTIEPSWIRIAMSYGFMRANDVVGPFKQGTTSQMLNNTSDDITLFRMAIMQTEIKVHDTYGAPVGNALGGPDFPARAQFLHDVRNMKRQLHDKVKNRREVLGGAVPPEINDWWNNWELIDGSQVTLAAPTPWVQVTLGDIVVPEEAPPPQL